VCLLLVCVAIGQALAQAPVPQPAPQIDRKDPTAVVQAYVRACETGDVKTAVALLDDKSGLRKGVEAMAQGMNRDLGPQGLGFRDVLIEFSFLPLGTLAGTANAQVKTEGGATRVIVTQTPTITRTFELVKGDDGTWGIDLEKSVLLSTGKTKSVMMLQLQHSPGSSGGAPDASRWEDRNRLQRLAQALLEYVAEHGNRFPPADKWVDEMEKYCLDPSLLHRAGLKPDQYGYAINANLAGKPLSDNWEERRNLVVVFESTDLSRNAAGDPDALPPRQPGSPPIWVATAAGNTTSVPVGMTLRELAEAQPLSDACSRHMTMIAKALLAYARDHGGLLPPAASWCDEIGPSIMPDAATGKDVFQCPADPDHKYGYALNAALAGKNVRTLTDHGDRVMLLHAKAGVRNEVVQVPAIAQNAIHTGGMYYDGDGEKYDIVVMLDGSLRQVPEGQPYPTPPPGR